MSVINISHLSKKYRHQMVIKDLSLVFNQGELIFLIGRNGSGKTTFIKCLLNLINYQGKIENHHLTFSYCPEKLILPDYLTLIDFLTLMGKVKGINEETLTLKINYYVSQFHLAEHLDKYLIKLSQGTKQKLLLILTLMVESDVYIFDEPLNGLDQSSRLFFYEELRRLQGISKTIIISTHNLSSFRFPEKVIVDFNSL